MKCMKHCQASHGRYAMPIFARVLSMHEVLCRLSRVASLLLEQLSISEAKGILNDPAWRTSERQGLLFGLLQRAFTATRSSTSGGAEAMSQGGRQRCRELLQDAGVRQLLLMDCHWSLDKHGFNA
jgi:hypothetical protein